MAPTVLVRQRRELTKLWLAYKIPIIAVVTSLVVVGGGVQSYNAFEIARREAAMSELEDIASQATQAVSTQLSAQIERMDAALDLPELAAMASMGDSDGIIDAGESLRPSVPELVGMRALDLDSRAPDYEASPPITYAALGMLKNSLAEESNPEPEVLLAGQEREHIAVLRRLEGSDGMLAGHVLLGLDTTVLKRAMGGVEIGDDQYLELVQGAGKGQSAVSSRGASSARQSSPGVSRPVKGTTLRVQLWSEALNSAASSGQIPALLIALGAGVLAAFVSLAVVARKNASGKPDRAATAPGVEAVADGRPDEVPLPHNLALPTVDLVEERPMRGGEDVPDLAQSIFRAYDVRGVVDETLTEPVVRQLGLAIGSEAYERGQQTLVVGGDGRLSTPSLVAALVDGLRVSGRDVIDVGRVPTPVLYYATHYLETGSGVMVTGSHNPPEYNGFKMMLAGDTLFGDDIQALRSRIENQEFTSGAGNLQSMDIAADYIRRVSEDVPVALGNAFKVVVDCGNGVAGDFAPKLIRALGHDVIELYCDVDGNFPNHHPDPSQPENLEDLIQTVREQGADLGFAFDGDGDRLGVVDGDGKIIWPDVQMMLYARDVLSRNSGAQIVFDVKCSSRLAKVIAKLGGKPVMYKTGHSFMKNKLKETGAPLAGEMSGHIFFKERWYGFDDALYTAARMLEILMGVNMPPSQVFAKLPTGESTPELKIEMREGENTAFMQALSEGNHFGDAEVTTIDGVRVDWEDCWGLVRASNTTPSLVLRFEGDTSEALERVKERFREVILAQNPELSLPF